MEYQIHVTHHCIRGTIVCFQWQGGMGVEAKAKGKNRLTMIGGAASLGVVVVGGDVGWKGASGDAASLIDGGA